MVERETVKDDGTVVRRCVSAGVHLFVCVCDFLYVLSVKFENASRAVGLSVLLILTNVC